MNQGPEQTPLAAGPGAYTRILQVFAMRPGEVERALLAFLYLFFIIGSYLLIKAIRNSLFISEFGAMKLPYVMLGIALLAGAFASVYIRLAKGRDTAQVIAWSLFFFAANVLLFWWLALEGHSWLYPVIYLWAGLFGVIAPTQVWTLANELFTTREAKRLFGVVGSGGILGGFVGGWLAAKLAPMIGTTHLMLVVVAMLILAALTVERLARLRRGGQAAVAGPPAPRNLTQSLKVISRSSHLRLMAGLVFVSALATTSVDFQFSVIAEQSISERDKLTAFFGAVYGTVSLVAFLLQLVLTSRVLAFFGVGFAILLLPFSLIFGTATLFLTGSLAAGVFLKGSDGALKHSLDRSCRELMYLPVPARIKLHAKSTIDTVMDRLGDGSAGALQLLITAGLGLGLSGSLAANFFVIGVWVVLARQLKHEYIGQLRSALKRPRSSPVYESIDDADSRSTLQQVLRSGSEAEQLGALEWISVNGVELEEQLLLELSRDATSPAVRRAALGIILSHAESEFPDELMSGLEEEGQSVLVSAIDLVTESDTQRSQEKLEALLDSAGDTTRLTLVAFMLRRMGPEFEPFARGVFDRLLAPEAPTHARVAAAHALGLLPRESSLCDRLAPLLDDGDLAVAVAAVETAGSSGRDDLVPQLIELLARPRLRVAARGSLRVLGAMATDSLIAHLAERSRPSAERRQIPLILAHTAIPASIEALVEGIGDEDYTVARASVAALHRMRKSSAGLEVLNARHVSRAVLDRVKRHVELRAAVVALGKPATDARPTHAWLLDALHEEQAAILDSVFMLLATGHAGQDIGRTWLALRYGSPVDRANAVELLDNLLPNAFKKQIVAMLEESNGMRPHDRGQAFTREQALERLVRWPNPWIAACAWAHARETPSPELEGAARIAGESADPLLREEAAAYLAAMPAGDTR